MTLHHDTGIHEHIDFLTVNRESLDSITCDGHSILNIPHDLHNIPDHVIYFAIVVYTLSMMVCVTICVWVIYYRQRRLVRNSSPPFLIQILVGAMVCMSTIIPLMQQDNHLSERAIHDYDETEGHISKNEALDVSCQLQPFIFSLGFGIMYSALLLKSWRLAKLFNNRKLRRLFISDARLLAYQAVVVTVVVSLNLIWVLADPLTWDRFPLAYDAHSGLVIESRGLCESPNAATSMIPLVSMIFLSLIYGVYLIYISRDVPTQFSESKWIGMSIVMMIEAMILGVPVLVLSHEESTSGFVVKFLMITLISMGTVVLIFIPKLLMAYGYGGADVLKIMKFVKKGETSRSNSNSNTGKVSSKGAGKTSRTGNNSRHQLFGKTAVSSWFDLPESTANLPESTANLPESTFQDIAEEEPGIGIETNGGKWSKDHLFKRGRTDSKDSVSSKDSKSSKGSKGSKGDNLAVKNTPTNRDPNILSKDGTASVKSFGSSRNGEGLGFVDQLRLILQTRNSRAALGRKLRETHAEEPVLLYGEAHQFTHEKNPKKRGVLGRKIMETYIIGSAPKQINFKSDTLQEMSMMYNLSCAVSSNPASTKVDPLSKANAFDTVMNEMFAELKVSPVVKKYVKSF